MIWLVEYDLLPEESATAMITTLVPSGKIATFVGVCVMIRVPDKSVARIKFVPVTLVMVAEQLEFAAMTRLVKLQRMVGGVVSRTMTVRVMEFVLPLPST